MLVIGITFCTLKIWPALFVPIEILRVVGARVNTVLLFTAVTTNALLPCKLGIKRASPTETCDNSVAPGQVNVLPLLVHVSGVILVIVFISPLLNLEEP